MNSEYVKGYSEHHWLPIPVQRLSRLTEVRSLLEKEPSQPVSAEVLFYRRLFGVETASTTTTTTSASDDISVIRNETVGSVGDTRLVKISILAFTQCCFLTPRRTVVSRGWF